MQFDQVTGTLRALVPALVAYLVGRGIVPEGAAADVSTAILAFAAAGWSIWSNRKAAKIASVAAMPETKVKPGGIIEIRDSELARVARQAATPNSSADAR